MAGRYRWAALLRGSGDEVFEKRKGFGGFKLAVAFNVTPWTKMVGNVAMWGRRQESPVNRNMQRAISRRVSVLLCRAAEDRQVSLDSNHGGLAIICRSDKAEIKVVMHMSLSTLKC